MAVLALARPKPGQLSLFQSHSFTIFYVASFFALAGTPYHRNDPNHRSIVSAIAVQTTLVTTRNTKPNPNIASARYSVPIVAPPTTNKAHAARPMRLMFNWKRRLARLQGGFGRDSIGGNTNYVFTILHLSRGALQRNQGTKGDLSGCVRPRDSSPVVQRRTWEALANSGAFPLVK